MNLLLIFNSHFDPEKYSWNDSYAEEVKVYGKEVENYTVSHENVTYEEEYNDYIFDNILVRTLFIVLYSIVFCGCVFGEYTPFQNEHHVTVCY